MASMSRNPRMLFGQRIAALRRARGWSQEHLAVRAGLHRTYIGRVERAEQNISLDNIFKIATALQVQPSDLMPPMPRQQGEHEAS